MTKIKPTNNSEIIKQIIDKNQCIVATGGFFGDEAKGKTVDAFSKYVDVIIRTNGGANAGHTVSNNGKKFVFHLMPSAVMTGKPVYIGENCVIDPISFFDEEVSILIENDIDYSNLVIGNSHVVTPLHIFNDKVRNPNASTGKGITGVHEDIVGKRSSRLEDFLNNDLDKLEKSIIH